MDGKQEREAVWDVLEHGVYAGIQHSVPTYTDTVS